MISNCPLSIARTEMPGTGRNAANGGGVKKSVHVGGETSGLLESGGDEPTDGERIATVVSVGGGVTVGSMLLPISVEQAATSKAAGIPRYGTLPLARAMFASV